MWWSRRLLAAIRFWLRMKFWNFIGSRTKNTGVLLPTMSKLPSTGVELQREAARIAPGVWAAALAGDRREPGHHLGLGAGLEERGLGVLADVLGHLELAERAAALGVGLPLRDALPVEVGHLLDEVVILQQDRAVGPDGQRVLDARRRCAGIGRRELFGHQVSSPR